MVFVCLYWMIYISIVKNMCYNLKIMPSNTTSNMFFYIYVLESLKDGNRYIGYTHNLKRRIKEHQSGYNFSTKFRIPFKLIYFEGCLNE